MNIEKNLDESCVCDRGVVILTYRIERLTVSECDSADRINAFLESFYDNVKRYVNERLAKEASAEKADPNDRRQRLRRAVGRYLLESHVREIEGEYLSFDIAAHYNGKCSHRSFVISAKDGCFENPESFIAPKKVKRYMKDDISLTGDALTVYHKGKKINMKFEK